MLRRVGSAAGAALLADAHRELDRGALEPELLTEPALDEAPVAGLDEAGGEEDEPRRPGPGLGGEEDAGLLPTADRVRVRIGRSAALAIRAGSAPVAAATAAPSVAAAKADAFSITMPTASGAVIAPCDIRRLRRKITSAAAVTIWE